MPEFSPKSQFLLYQTGHAAKLQENREQSWLTTSFTYTLAQMAHNGASAEKLAGAREFVKELQELWEKPDKDKKLPVKRPGHYPPELLDQQPTPTTKKK